MSAMSPRRVAVFGGGPGGLSAALELAERGYDVDLYERNTLGGKARGYRIAGTGRDGRADLPGEIGPHVSFGFYASLPDTLRRIPTTNGGNAWDNFALPCKGVLTWKGETVTLTTDFGHTARTPTPSRGLPPSRWLRQMLTARDRIVLASKFVALATSGPARQFGQLEHISVYDYLEADRLSPAARELLEQVTAAGIGKIDRMSARLLGRLVRDFGAIPGGRTYMKEMYRVANKPYDEAVFEPWGDHLRALGARIHLRHKLLQLNFDNGRIAGADIEVPEGNTQRITADWYVLALPPDRAADLVAPLTDVCPSLAAISRIEPTWLGGVGIYLRNVTPELRKSFLTHGQPWKMAVIGYTDLWSGDFSERHGDGTVKDYVSVDIPDWDAPGIVYSKPPKELTRRQIAEEVLAQLRREPPDGERLLAESNIASVVVSPSFLGGEDEVVTNDEPLFVNTTSSWQDQPDAVTGISNLFLAASYVRTDGGGALDSMDSAVEAGRRAANGILDAAGDHAQRAHIAEARIPGLVKRLMDLDNVLYWLGLPNPFDIAAPKVPRHSVFARLRRGRQIESRSVPAKSPTGSGKDNVRCAS